MKKVIIEEYGVECVVGIQHVSSKVYDNIAKEVEPDIDYIEIPINVCRFEDEGSMLTSNVKLNIYIQKAIDLGVELLRIKIRK